MNYLQNYYNNIVKYDLINKFQYKTINKLPKIYKVILSFNYKNPNLRQLMSSLTALELISAQKPIFTNSKVPVITLKIRKGNPVGCKVTLRRDNLNNFFHKLFNEILCDSDLITNYKILNKTSTLPTFTFKLKNNLNFNILETHYQIFKNLPKLNIVIVTNSKNFSEFIFLLKSYKIFK